MYHIKNDKRCLRSAEAITTALDYLLNKKSFMDISVSDIQRASGVGRSTFYRLFDTIDDVLEYSIDQGFREVTSEFQKGGWKDFTEYCLRYIMKDGDRIMNIVAAGRSGLIVRSLRRNLQKLAGETGVSPQSDMYYSFAVFAGACTSVITAWDENGRKESVEELAEYLIKFLNYDALTAAQLGARANLK